MVALKGNMTAVGLKKSRTRSSKVDTMDKNVVSPTIGEIAGSQAPRLHGAP